MIVFVIDMHMWYKYVEKNLLNAQKCEIYDLKQWKRLGYRHFPTNIWPLYISPLIFRHWYIWPLVHLATGHLATGTFGHWAFGHWYIWPLVHLATEHLATDISGHSAFGHWYFWPLVIHNHWSLISFRKSLIYLQINFPSTKCLGKNWSTSKKLGYIPESISLLQKVWEKTDPSQENSWAH